MQSKRALGFFALAVALSACGGSVEQSESTGGSAGVGGTGAVGGAAGFGGIAGAGGGIAGAGGGSGGAACGGPHEGLTVKVSPAWGAPPTCTMGEDAEWEATGSVSKSDGNTLILDTCPPNADCMPSMTTVYVEAPGLSMFIPPGAFVKVRYELVPSWGGCNTRISIQNVPSWGGVANPVEGGQGFHLLATDGVLDHPQAPFAVGKLPLGCGTGAPSCGEPADDYALTFTVAPGDPGAVVPMGQSQVLGKLASQPMLVHNLRSFVSGWCDDYWNWAWWATRAYVK